MSYREAKRSPKLDPYQGIGGASRQVIRKGDDIAVQMLDTGVSPMPQNSCDPGFIPILAAAQYG